MNLAVVGLIVFAALHTEVQTEITNITANDTTLTTLNTETTTQASPLSTTGSPEPACNQENTTTCEQCLARGTKCYFCRKTKKCAFYPYTHIAPRPGECGSLGDVAWGTCLVNFEILIICMSVIGGILIIGLIICCCCCCRKRGRDKWAKQQAKWEREREERKTRNQERKKERQAKTDEIRRKYGLVKDDNPYQRFDA